jgi:hypothetical protein
MRRGGGRQHGDAGAAGDEAALLDPLALARRGRNRFDGDRHQALVRISETATPASGLAAAAIVALVNLQQAVEWEFRALAQPVAQLVRHQPRRVVAQRQFARQEQRRHAALVLRHHPRRREPFAQRRAGAVKHRPGGHRMLLPTGGALENPRPSRQLIGRPPSAARAYETLGPAQLRQCRDARRLVPIAIHELKKSGHHRPLRHLTKGAGYSHN